MAKSALLLLLLGALVLLCRAESTDLQRAFERAFNERVADGTWTSLLAPYVSLANSCPASAGNSAAWAWPNRTSGTDLDRVLRSGQFKCGYPNNTAIHAESGDLLFRTDGAGPVGDFWRAAISTIASHYGVALTINWTVAPNSDANFDRLLAGDIDSICGIVSLGALYRGVARVHAANACSCLTFTKDIPIWVPVNNSAATLSEVATALRAGAKMCTATSPGGGTANQCTALVSQLAPGLTCAGLQTAAYDIALNDPSTCTFVWQDGPPRNFSGQFRRVPTSFTDVESSFFRKLQPAAPTTPPTVADPPGSVAVEVVPVWSYVVMGVLGVLLLILLILVVVFVLRLRAASGSDSRAYHSH